MTEVTTLTLQDALSEVGGWIAGSSYEQAIERCDEMAAFYPDAVRLLWARARAYELLGDMARASDDYCRIVDITPADARAMVGLARCQANAGQHAESTVNALQALAFLPNDPDALHIAGNIEDGPVARGEIAMARSLFRGGIINRAFASMRRMITTVPDRADVQIALAEMLWRSGFKVSTVELCQSILDAQPDCLNAHIILAALWAQIGNMDIAGVHQAAVERLDPDYRAAREWLEEASPFVVRDVAAYPQPIPREEVDQPLEQGVDSELDRSAWVDELIAAASPVAPTPEAPALPPTENRAPDLMDAKADPDADAEAYAEGEGVIGTTPLEWSPAHAEDQAEDIPAWLTALRTEKAPETVAETDPDQPIERAADENDALHRSTRTGTVTKWSPEPPPTVTLTVASAPSGTAPVPAPVIQTPQAPPLELQVGVATDESLAPAIPSPTPAPEFAPVSDIPEIGSSFPARKKARKARVAKPKLSTDNLLDMAHKALETGDYEVAADHYATLVRAGKKLDTLLAELDAAAQAYPRVPHFYTLLGDVYKRKGDIDAALIAYHRALATAETRD